MTLDLRQLDPEYTRPDEVRAFPTRPIIGVLVWLLVFTCAIGAAVWLYVYHITYPALLEEPAPVGIATEFEITPGTSLTTIAANLKTQKLVVDDWALLEYLKRHDLDSGVQAGYFTFTGTETIPELAAKLAHGGTKQVKLTVLEGWNSDEIDNALRTLGLTHTVGAFSQLVKNGTLADMPAWAANRPTNSLEGYLFPSTYFLDPQHFSMEKLATRMLAEMEQQLTAVGYDATKSTRSLHDILTVASLIQLEEHDPVRQPLVADVIWRRLDAGWQLGVDATLFYQLGHKTNLTADDLALNSPYNTRTHRGLPPTPIASPGRAALEAAIKPQKNEFWYYLHDADGIIHFAKTLDEHNQNKAQFLH